MRDQILALIFTAVIVVFLIGTFYALAKTILAFIGLFYVISLVLKVRTATKEDHDGYQRS